MSSTSFWNQLTHQGVVISPVVLNEYLQKLTSKKSNILTWIVLSFVLFENDFESDPCPGLTTCEMRMGGSEKVESP